MIRQIVRHLLEAAVASKEAASKNLALYHRNNGNYATYILYDPAALEEDLLKHGSADPLRVIYGFLEVKPHPGECWNATEIVGSAAQKGYGPLMYELAMSDYSGLMPDRKSTSQSARRVWQVYNQRQDVDKKKLDDKANPQTPPKVDDCAIVKDGGVRVDYLNNVYSGDGDPSDKQTMIRNHEMSEMAIAKRTDKTIGDIRRALALLGTEFFTIRYIEGGG